MLVRKSVVMVLAGGESLQESPPKPYRDRMPLCPEGDGSCETTNTSSRDEDFEAARRGCRWTRHLGRWYGRAECVCLRSECVAKPRSWW